MRINSLGDMLKFGESIGARMRGREVFELVGDVGAGKTSFVKGLARGMEITEVVQSPTFTISREYESPRGLRLVHYDFYRLGEAGIMAEELAESLADARSIVVVEWAESVATVMPKDRIAITINLVADDENARDVTWQASGSLGALLTEAAS